MADPIQAPIPLLNIPVVNRDGYISQPWMMFFLTLQTRTGGASGQDGQDADEDNGRTWALSVESTLAQPVPDIAAGTLANEAFAAPPGVSANDIFSGALAQEMVYPQVVGAPTLTDIIQQVLNYERDFSTGSSAQQMLSDILAPLVNNAVADILANETFSAPGASQNATSEMLAASGQTQSAMPEMTFSPVQSTAFARDPIQVVATSSPVTVVARGPYATLSIDGGTITGITVQRGTWSRTVGNTTAFIAMSPGDTVTITYLVAPTLYFLPRI